MNIDTIVTDMDDTLLDGSGRLSEYTLRVMHECTRRGVRVIPVSGRTYYSMRPYMLQLDTGMPYIGGNGSEIVGADHRLIEQQTLDVELGKELCAYMLSEGCYAQVYREESFYFAEECEPARLYRNSSGMNGVPVGDLPAFLDFPTPKVLGVNTVEEVRRIMPLIQKRFEGRAVITMSKPIFLEAEPLNVSKGNALKRLAELRGDIVPERTLAFGDSLNGISLLAYTPNSVAMGNAREELKQTAAYVCRPNAEDGLARFVEEHVLNA